MIPGERSLYDTPGVCSASKEKAYDGASENNGPAVPTIWDSGVRLSGLLEDVIAVLIDVECLHGYSLSR